MRNRRFVVSSGALLGLSLLMGCASTAPQSSQMYTRSGAELFESLCASCHGVQGRGDGPIAPLIKVGVPDLTLLAYRDGGEFPADDVRRTIDGRFERRAHGPRDMPVWGWQFYDMSSSEDAAERARVDALIDRLTGYLQSIQREKP